MTSTSVEFQVLSTEETAARIATGHPIVVEALGPEYYRAERLPGAINIPHTEVDRLAPEVLPDKEAEIIVYCASGPCQNSAVAARRLVELGYRNVFDFAGGKEDWMASGRPLVS
ncbi:rhodanese-like domain-containing protein [Isoptericola sp. BMS4]|uniref:rhodanese-like domain-containing protein n=1 Tax=Isoptericola sp. BMS4 TaxID=2527875 RepID=UPI00141F938B|nr:rhodanese-like domain-containing protein [Isoptericola sp. BMS4]